MTEKAERAKDAKKPSRWQRRQADAAIDPSEEHLQPKGPLAKQKRGERIDNQENPTSRWWGRWRS